MPKPRKEIENLEELVKNKKKKYVRCAEGAELYSMGVHSFRLLTNCHRIELLVVVNMW